MPWRLKSSFRLINIPSAFNELFKRCNHCGKRLRLNEFYKAPYSKSGRRSFCKQCMNSVNKKYCKQYYRRNRAPGHGMEVNKKCANYLGVYIAENILKNYFKNLKKMPTNHPGYDFLCEKGLKVDVKSSCLQFAKNDACESWSFTVRQNKIADYFLCLAFDNRETLKPMHIWLIPAERICNLKIFRIFNNERSINKWSTYERPIGSVLIACETMKERGISEEEVIA